MDAAAELRVSVKRLALTAKIKGLLLLLMACSGSGYTLAAPLSFDGSNAADH